MSKKLFLMIVLILIFLTACGGGNIDSPPLVYLLSGSELVDGFQSSYCWEEGVGATLCVDTMEPYFNETTSLSASEAIRFQFDTPLPDEVTISISDELFGESIISESMAPSDFIDWSPTVAPGAYIIDVHTSWKQGDVTYWFSVVLE
ncbi:MAG: hypothetical protein HN855_13060 [Anaerolineae bacterium]|jgi:hypothetical protein|nr:hypothetical protein [Anaerolineae bacterium]MBT7073225.1 hypothetical protein [Anaerolineae bacterium]MBT7326084.1 hypothetical protein [Anaerolineae bacterium]